VGVKGVYIKRGGARVARRGVVRFKYKKLKKGGKNRPEWRNKAEIKGVSKVYQTLGFGLQQ